MEVKNKERESEEKGKKDEKQKKEAIYSIQNIQHNGMKKYIDFSDKLYIIQCCSTFLTSTLSLIFTLMDIRDISALVYGEQCCQQFCVDVYLFLLGEILQNHWI